MSGNPITEISISTNTTEEEQLQRQNFTRVEKYLNENSTVLLWYKSGEGTAITRIQFSFNESMRTALRDAGFMTVKTINIGDNKITMWCMNGTTQYDIPIVSLFISNSLDDEITNIKCQWEQLGCDLNRFGTGNPIYVWAQRQQQFYICNIVPSTNTARETDLFKKGYIRIDEDINRGVNPPGSPVFLFYRRSFESHNSISDLDVSLNGQEERLLNDKHYTKVHDNLNDGTPGRDVHLWYKKHQQTAIRNIFVLVGNERLEMYGEAAGCTRIEKNLNNTDDTPLYIAFTRVRKVR